MRKRVPFRDGAFPPAPPLLFAFVVAVLLLFASVSTGWPHGGWSPGPRCTPLSIAELDPLLPHRPLALDPVRLAASPRWVRRRVAALQEKWRRKSARRRDTARDKLDALIARLSLSLKPLTLRLQHLLLSALRMRALTAAATKPVPAPASAPQEQSSDTDHQSRHLPIAPFFRWYYVGIIAALLVISGIEVNPGPYPQDKHLSSANLRYLSIPSHATQEEATEIAHDDWRIRQFVGEGCVFDTCTDTTCDCQHTYFDDTWSDAWDNKSSTSESHPYEQDPHPDDMCLEFLFYLRIPDEVTQDEYDALAHDDWRIRVFYGEVCAGPFPLRLSYLSIPHDEPVTQEEAWAIEHDDWRICVFLGEVCPGPCDAFYCPDCHGYPEDGIWDKSVSSMNTDDEERLIDMSAYRARAQEYERTDGGGGLYMCDEAPPMYYERPARQRPRSSTPPDPSAIADFLSSLSNEPRRKRERTEHQTERPATPEEREQPLPRDVINDLLLRSGIESNPGPSTPPRMSGAHIGTILRKMKLGDVCEMEWLEDVVGLRRTEAALVSFPTEYQPLYLLRKLDSGVEAFCPLPAVHYTSFRHVPPAVATMPTPPPNAALPPVAASPQHQTTPTPANTPIAPPAPNLPHATAVIHAACPTSTSTCEPTPPTQDETDNAPPPPIVASTQHQTAPAPTSTPTPPSQDETDNASQGWLTRPPNATARLPSTPSPGTTPVGAKRTRSAAASQSDLLAPPPVHMPPLGPFQITPTPESLANLHNVVHAAPEQQLDVRRPFAKATEPADAPVINKAIPRVAHLPQRLSRNWGEAFDTLLEGYRQKDRAQRDVTMAAVLKAPQILLPQTKKRAGNRNIPAMTAEEISNATPPEARPLKSKTPEERVLNRCKTLAITGLYSNAVKVLMREISPHVAAEELVARLCRLHPKRAERIELCGLEAPVELRLPPPQRRPGDANNPEAAAKAGPPLKIHVQRSCRGKSPGPTGWTEELIRDAITPQNCGAWMAIFEDIVNARFNADVTRLLRQAILVGIPKGDDGVRPLALGEALVKVGVKILLAMDKELKDDVAVGDFQYAFKPDGCAQIIHQVRELLRADPSEHAILVDCTNAFNSVRRQCIRDVLMSSSRFNSLRALFNAFYVEQGDLIIRGDGEEHPVISSTEGVRQGDVLGPLFFCLALRPAVARALERFNEMVAGSGKQVRVFAYMDDVTIVGKTGPAFEFYTLLSQELAHIGLAVNNAKTVTTDTALAPTMACKQASCVKLLGAYVSRNATEEKTEVDKQPAKHEVFFNRIPHLPAEIGYRLLVLCGVPKWAHLIRTHEPDVTVPASKAFTEMSVRCLAAVLRADYNNLDEETYRQMRIPIRLGGLGITDWSEMAENAYNMSKALQRTRDDERDTFAQPETRRDENAFCEKMMEEIKAENPAFHSHLKRFSGRVANLWLFGEITAASAMASNSFRAAMLFRLNWAGPNASLPAPAPCACGFPKVNIASVTRKDMMMHQAGCVTNAGPTSRHHAVRDALIGLMTRAGYLCKREDEVGTTGEGENKSVLRMDIVATPPTGPQLYVDVTICNPAARSYANKTEKALFDAQKKEKEKRYAEIAKTNGCELVTFSLTVFGSMSDASRKLISALVTSLKARCSDNAERAAITVSATLNFISKALAYGNGACLLFSNQLLTMYGVSLKGTPKEIRAPVGFRALGDGDDVDAVGAEDSEDEGGDAKAIVAAAVTARDDAWSDAGDADGEAGSDEEDARSMMSCEDVDEAAAGSRQETVAPAIYSGHDVARGDEAEDAAAVIVS